MKTDIEKKIAIIGKSRISKNDYSNYSQSLINIGYILQKESYTAYTGACGGFPELVSKGIYQSGGVVIGYSPGRNLDEHINIYTSPTDYISHLIFTQGGLIQRELELLRQVDKVLVVDGNIGTMTELFICIKEEIPLIVISDINEFGQKVKDVLFKFNVYPEPKIEYINITSFEGFLK